MSSDLLAQAHADIKRQFADHDFVLDLSLYQEALARLDEIREMAISPGFATSSGEPRDALDAIVRVIDRPVEET